MTELPSEVPNEPDAVRQFAKEACDFADNKLCESYESTFGLSVDALISDPKLLEKFMDHDDPRLRAVAVSFASRYYHALSDRLGHFTELCIQLASAESHKGLRHAAIVAMGSIYPRTLDKAILANLARLALDPHVEEFFRNQAYLAFNAAVGMDSRVPGAFDAYLNAREVLDRGMTNRERNYIRTALRNLF